MTTIYLLILLSVCINVAAQLLLKAGANQLGHYEFAAANVWPIAVKVLTNFPIMAGLALYGSSVVVWLMVLSRAPVSMAYPMASLGYVIMPLAANLIFNEPLSTLRMAGIGFIVAGVCLIARS